MSMQLSRLIFISVLIGIVIGITVMFGLGFDRIRNQFRLPGRRKPFRRLVPADRGGGTGGRHG